MSARLTQLQQPSPNRMSSCGCHRAQFGGSAIRQQLGRENAADWSSEESIARTQCAEEWLCGRLRSHADGPSIVGPVPSRRPGRTTRI